MKTKTASRLMLIAGMLFVAFLIGGRNHDAGSQNHGIGSAAEAQQIGQGVVIQEDDPRWNCTTMGNKLCSWPNTPGPFVSMFPGEMGDRMLVIGCDSALKFGSELDIDYWC